MRQRIAILALGGLAALAASPALGLGAPGSKALTKHRFEAPLQGGVNNAGLELNGYYKHHVPKYVSNISWENVNCGGPYAGTQHWQVTVNAKEKFHATHAVVHGSDGEKVKITGTFTHNAERLHGTFEVLGLPPSPECPTGGTGTLKYSSN
jgi:hypothetical protein